MIINLKIGGFIINDFTKNYRGLIFEEADEKMGDSTVKDNFDTPKTQPHRKKVWWVKLEGVEPRFNKIIKTYDTREVAINYIQDVFILIEDFLESYSKEKDIAFINIDKLIGK